jgi:hypothetical protein
VKRFVYVPANCWNGELPIEATSLAEQTSLPIRIGTPDDGIDVSTISLVSIPEIAHCDAPSSGTCGFIFPVDITNEFVLFDSTTSLVITCGDNREVFEPRLKEKHRAKFRPRLTHRGSSVYAVVVNNEIIASGNFVTI